MQITKAIFPQDLETIQEVAQRAFSSTPDSSLSEWFSFESMQEYIKNGRGLCLKAVNENNKIVGMMYAQQESPINGKEGLEKWVVILAAVTPEASGSGIGAYLLKEMETQAIERGAVKMFVYTNKDDERVIHFYQKNGYEDAGWIRDYQYGKGNSAVFLLKYLDGK